MPDGPVAQLDRASDYESEGRMFESCRVHHTLITEAEYLTTTYRPDCDYIRGELQERNVGQKDHSIFQGNFLVWFHARRSQLGLRAFVELRVRVAAGRYRIPDVCVVRLPAPDEQILTSPPYIMIEVLSSNDSFPRLQQRLDDYLAMGVPNVWVLDSETGRGWHVTP